MELLGVFRSRNWNLGTWEQAHYPHDLSQAVINELRTDYRRWDVARHRPRPTLIPMSQPEGISWALAQPISIPVACRRDVVTITAF